MPQHYYQDEHATIYHGDCREILPLLPKCDAIVTDPPYGIYDHGGKWGRKHEQQWDREAADVTGLLPLSDQVIIWGGNYFPLPPSRGWLVWHKRDSNLSAADCELAWTSFDMNTRLIDCTIAATNGERCGHPTQKPLRVMKWSIGFTKGETILDPFMGSGTTLRAAKDLGRRAIGIEISERYCEIAAQRMRQMVLGFTG